MSPKETLPFETLYKNKSIHISDQVPSPTP